MLGKEDAPCNHKYDITGSLCENNDKFAIDRMLPEINIGDYLFIHLSGVYGIPTPPERLINAISVPVFSFISTASLNSKEYIGVDACAVNLMRPAMYGAYHHITVLGKEDAPCNHKYDITGYSHINHHLIPAYSLRQTKIYSPAFMFHNIYR